MYCLTTRWKARFSLLLLCSGYEVLWNFNISVEPKQLSIFISNWYRKRVRSLCLKSDFQCKNCTVTKSIKVRLWLFQFIEVYDEYKLAIKNVSDVFILAAQLINLIVKKATFWLRLLSKKSQKILLKVIRKKICQKNEKWRNITRGEFGIFENVFLFSVVQINESLIVLLIWQKRQCLVKRATNFR